MTASTKTPAPAEKQESQGKRKHHMGTGAVIGITNCALGGVTAAYLTTGSVQVPLIAAVAAVLLTGLAMFRG